MAKNETMDEKQGNAFQYDLNNLDLPDEVKNNISTRKPHSGIDKIVEDLCTINGSFSVNDAVIYAWVEHQTVVTRQQVYNWFQRNKDKYSVQSGRYTKTNER